MKNCLFLLLNSVYRRLDTRFFYSDIHFPLNYKNAAHYLCLEHFVGVQTAQNVTM